MKAEDPIPSLIRQVDAGRMGEMLCYLAKEPLPCRKANYARPGQSKSTLDEADEFIQGRLEAWGYAVEREQCLVQAFGCDETKQPRNAQYAPPEPEQMGPWSFAPPGG